MLDRTLGFLLDQVNGYLERRYPSNEPHAVLTGLCYPDGGAPTIIENKVVLSLINIERESAAASFPPLKADGAAFTRMSPALNLNLYLLVSACFRSNYPEALKLLSAVLALFQSQPVYSAQNVAAFPSGLDKLTLEIVNLGIQELNSLWGNIGGKYLPSVLYKVRMVTVQEGWIREKVPRITGTATTV